jgi:hypothetical protein
VLPLIEMKRTAAQAFATPPVPTSGVFQPNGNAMLDPKAYFAQFQQAAMQGQAVAPPGTVPPAAASTAPAPAEEKSEVHLEVEAASAIKCARILQEKGANFTTTVAIEALTTMATKSSYKLREELLRQPHVKKLCERVRTVLLQPPTGLSLEVLSKAAWSLIRFPDEVLGDPAVTLGPLARLLKTASTWHANIASRILYVLAKANTNPKELNFHKPLIMQPEHKHLVTQVVKEFIRDAGRRVAELSQEELVNMLSSIAKARVHIPIKGENQTVRCQANDELYFSYASKRIIDEVDTMDGRVVADVAHVHAEAGIRDEKLFKAICPRIMAKQKELDEKTMGRCIKAYARFMIPLREEQQGFRTMAVVAKGDFIRPSEKPKRSGPRTYDKPLQLYEKTQLHSRA